MRESAPAAEPHRRQVDAALAAGARARVLAHHQVFQVQVQRGPRNHVGVRLDKGGRTTVSSTRGRRSHDEGERVLPEPYLDAQ